MNGLPPEVASLSQACEDRQAWGRRGGLFKVELCGPGSPRHGLWLISLASMQPQEGSSLAILLRTAHQARILKSSQILSFNRRPELEVKTPSSVCRLQRAWSLPFLAFLFVSLLIKRNLSSSLFTRSCWRLIRGVP